MNTNILEYGRNKEYDKVIQVAGSLCPEDCSSANEALTIGTAYEQLQAFSQSLPWYRRSHRLNPEDEVFGMMAGVCLATKNLEQLKECLSIPTADRDGYYYRATEYELVYRTGADNEEQIVTLERFLDIQAEESYMLRLATLYLEMGRDKEAGRLCKKAMRLFINGKAVEYAEELLSHIKAGDGQAFVRENPWLTDSVFHHVSFDLQAPAKQDVHIPSATKADVTPSAVATGEAGISFGKSLGFGKKDTKDSSQDKKDKKDKISPIVEKSLEGVVGMQELKRSLNSILNLLQVEKKRKDFESIIKNNIMILGPDGCGKTTAAEASCRALYKMGIIDHELPILADYEALVGADAEETHKNVEELFHQAENRCIIVENIHEFDDSAAYSLGLDAIDQLYKAYVAAGDSVTLIITGAEKETEVLLQKKRRFADIFKLPRVILGRYTTEDLLTITEGLAEQKGIVLSDEAKKKLESKLQSMIAQPDFAYTRDLDRIINAAYINMSNRVTTKRRFGGDDVYLITAEDIDAEDKAETVEELLAELQRMIGLSGVKAQVNSLINQVKIRKLREAAGFDAGQSGTLHMVFTGNAGTGKTTVARLIGRIYKRLGVLPKGQLIECTRKDLISDIYGQTAKLVSAKVREAMGGILFIDEAYALCKDPDNDSYGKEAVDTLIAEMENHRDSFMVIFAGYGADMDKFLDVNQGLRSRIPTHIDFEDYSVEERLQIFKKYVADRKMRMDIHVEEDVVALFTARAHKKDFGNARGVRNVFEDVLKHQANRLATMDPGLLTKNDFQIIRRADILALTDSDTEKSSKTADEYLAELYSLTGLASVKQKVRSVVASLRTQQLLKQYGEPTGGLGTLHMVFKGNAGTGKTTVARLVGNIFRELGVLSQGQFVECDRSHLVAGYVGQTAEKTKAKVMEAMGGVLFIDEAYSLAQGGEHDYGREAITELVADLENYRDDLCVIIAGYSSDMDVFLDANQGLKSRFPTEIVFEDYTVPELLLIFRQMIGKQNLQLEDGAEDMVISLLERHSTATDFGNARGVRNLVEKIKEQKNLRIMALLEQGVEPSKELLLTITTEDINALMY